MGGLENLHELSGHDRPGMTLYTRLIQFKEWRGAKNSRRRYEGTRIGISETSTTAIVMN